MQAIDEADDCEETSSTASSNPRSTDETGSNTPDLTSTSQTTDLAHHKPTTTLAQSATTMFDVQQTSCRNADHCGRRGQLAVEQRTFAPLQASNEASDPSRRRSPVWIELDGQGWPTLSTGSVAGDEDGTVDVEDLNAVDAGQTSVDDCLVKSLRAEVS